MPEFKYIDIINNASMIINKTYIFFIQIIQLKEINTYFDFSSP